jgi:hypothetical protein
MTRIIQFLYINNVKNVYTYTIYLLFFLVIIYKS